MSSEFSKGNVVVSVDLRSRVRMSAEQYQEAMSRIDSTLANGILRLVLPGIKADPRFITTVYRNGIEVPIESL